MKKIKKEKLYSRRSRTIHSMQTKPKMKNSHKSNAMVKRDQLMLGERAKHTSIFN